MLLSMQNKIRKRVNAGSSGRFLLALKSILVQDILSAGLFRVSQKICKKRRRVGICVVFIFGLSVKTCGDLTSEMARKRALLWRYSY